MTYVSISDDSSVQVCGKTVTSGNQKVLQPPGSAKLVLILHDIDLVLPDKYATAELLAFVEHAIQHGGFYDTHLDFVALRRTHFIATAGSSASDGCATLPPRLPRSLHTLAMAPVAQDEAVDALTPRAQAAAAAAGAPAAPASRIAAAALQLLAAFSAAFPSHVAAHYAVSLHDAAAVLDALPHYDWGDSVTAVSLALQNEARMRFQCRLQTASERARFNGIMQECVGSVDSAAAAGHGDVVYTTLGSVADERLGGSHEARKLCSWSISDFTELVRLCFPLPASCTYHTGKLDDGLSQLLLHCRLMRRGVASSAR